MQFYVSVFTAVEESGSVELKKAASSLSLIKQSKDGTFGRLENDER
jgi:hypothetical protein